MKSSFNKMGCEKERGGKIVVKSDMWSRDHFLSLYKDLVKHTKYRKMLKRQKR
jgi:hypothetical protein